MHGIYQHEQIRQEWFRHFRRHELMKKYIVSLGTLIYAERETYEENVITNLSKGTPSGQTVQVICIFLLLV